MKSTIRQMVFYPLIACLGFVTVTFVIFNNFENLAEQTLTSLQAQPGKFAMMSFGFLVSDILLPIPSSAFIHLNALVLGFAKGGLLSFVALLLNATIGFGLGRVSRNLKNNKSDIASRAVDCYGPMAIVVSRGIPVLSESVSFVCGFNKMRISTYLFLNLCGFFPVCVVYSAIATLGYGQGGFVLGFTTMTFLTGILWWLGRIVFVLRFRKKAKRC